VDQRDKPIAVLADDDPATISGLESQLRCLGYHIRTAGDIHVLLTSVRQATPSVILLHMRFATEHGLDVRKELRSIAMRAPVIFFSVSNSIEAAVQAVKLGADDFLPMPTDIERLKQSLRDSIRGRTETYFANRDSSAADSLLRGNSPLLEHVRATIAQVAPTDAPVMILGESGTGKELVAQEIHRRSRRARGKFVAINMAALPAHLLESTLFGHVRGAYTGADATQNGLCHEADRGTLLLDEISEMDFELQPKLLRFLQEGTIHRVGSNRFEKVDARIISATNRDPKKIISEGRFREDLYFRLNVVPIELPPLRTRRDDIELLVNHFLLQACERHGKHVCRVSRSTLDRLVRYDWPGNVRQLENVVHRMVVFANHEEITEANLPAEILQPSQRFDQAVRSGTQLLNNHSGNEWSTIENAERQLIFDALAKTAGNVGRAAGILGLGQATVYRKMKRYGIIRPEETSGKSRNELSD
jgi:DNA-binding NtrC family response regulator